MMILYDDGIIDEPCVSCEKSYSDDLFFEWYCNEKECIHKEEYKKKETYLDLREYLYLRPINEKYVEGTIYKPVCGDICLQVILFQKVNNTLAGRVIRNTAFENTDLTEEDIYLDAIENVIKRSKTCIFNLESGLKLFSKDEMKSGIDVNSVGSIITNEDFTYGAVNLFLPGVAKEIYEKIGVYYVCFTSVHEAAIHALRHFSNEEMLDGLFETLQEFTTTEGYGHDSDQTLSSYVYIYDPEEDKFEVAKK